MSKKPTVGIACNITTGKLDSNHAVKNGEFPFFTCAAEPDKIDSYAFDDNVVLIAGNNARGNFHVNRYKGKFNAYQRTYVLTAKDGFDIDFIYYSLKLELKRLREKSQGSQTKFLTMPILTNIVLCEIKKNYQQRIAAVLSSLDAKIELNNRINAKLEAMSKMLYDYWFVQFDFPFDFAQNKPCSHSEANAGRKKCSCKPYKSSGGKMVWNEQLKREIPAGWEVKRIGNELEVILGGTPSTKNNEFWNNGTLPWLTSGEVAEFPVVKSELKITFKAIQSSATELLPKGTVLLSITRHLRSTILAIDACANQSVVGIKEKGDIKNCYIYPLIKNEIPRYLSLRTGAQQPHINKETVEETWFIIPENTIIKKYNKLTDPVYSRITNAAFENLQTEKLRDWLLPMLMNGQVKVE